MAYTHMFCVDLMRPSLIVVFCCPCVSVAGLLYVLLITVFFVLVVVVAYTFSVPTGALVTMFVAVKLAAVTFIVPIANGKLFASRLNMIVEPELVLLVCRLSLTVRMCSQ